MGSPRRGPAWLRWLAVPWSERVLASTLVAAAAVPVFLVAAAGIWRSAAQDDVTARAVASASPTTHGIDVHHEVRFDPVTMPQVDDALRAATRSVPGLLEPDRSVYTFPSLLTIGPPVRQVGPTVRLFARAGALDAVEIVARADGPAGEADNGVYVSTWLADRLDLELGDGLALEAGAIADEEWNDLVAGGGAASVFRVIGLYEPLWSPDPDHELDPYWATGPAEPVPQYISAFDGPNSELILTAEETVLASGLTGVARWRADLAEVPTTFDGLRTTRDDLRRLDADLVRRGPLRDAMSAAATSADASPRLTTELFDTTSEVEAAVRQLDGPLAAAQAVGAAVGLLAVVAAGAFVVERRRTEFRLLASEGHGAVRLGALVGAQLLLPVVVGAACGVAAAVVGLRWFGPASRYDLAAVDLVDVVSVAVMAWVVAAVVAGRLGAGVLRERLVPHRIVVAAFVVALAVTAVAAWVQVGRTTRSSTSDVDLAVVGLPVVGVALAVTVAMGVIGTLLARTVRDGSRLPVPAFLAVRRLVVGGSGLRVVAGAVGLGVGLLVFATALTSTLDRTVDVKLATVVGGASALGLPGEPGSELAPPDRTTLVRTWDTVITPGRERVRVVAVDPATWPDAVSWPSQFGSSPDEVAELVASPLDGAVAAIAVTGERTPDSGAFGLTRTYAFEVVGRVAALPGAGENTTTLLVSAPALEDVAIEAEGYESRREAADDGFVLPTVRFRRRLVSQASLDELVAAVEAAGTEPRDVTSLAAERRDPGVLAVRAAFGYLGVLGVASATAAVAGLGLFLGSRRRTRALGSVMTRSMGLPSPRAALVTTMEVGFVLLVAVLGSVVAVPLVVHRLTPRFDPAPDIPPTVGVVVDWVPLLTTAIAATAVVAASVWWSELRSARRPTGEVLRDTD